MNTYVTDILLAQISGLPFIGSSAGLVRTVTMNETTATGTVRRKSFPVACTVSADDCATGKYTGLIPDNSKRSILYFEEATGVQHTGFYKNAYQYRSTVRLVGWLNLAKLGVTGCTWSAQAIMQILSALRTEPQNHTLLQRFKITAVNEVAKTAAIFGKYSYDEAVTQYLLFPYDYFALDITIEFQINPQCIELFTPSALNCEE